MEFNVNEKEWWSAKYKHSIVDSQLTAVSGSNQRCGSTDSRAKDQERKTRAEVKVWQCWEEGGWLQGSQELVSGAVSF